MDSRIREAQHLIGQTFSRQLSVKKLAKTVGLQLNHFEALFKAETGLTPKQYQKQARLAQAKRELLDPTRGVKEVAGTVGYKSVAHFCHDFKKATGQTPTEFRRAQCRTLAEELDEGS